VEVDLDHVPVRRLHGYAPGFLLCFLVFTLMATGANFEFLKGFMVPFLTTGAMSQLVYHHGVYCAELGAGLLSNICAWFCCCMKRLVFDVIVVVSHQNQKMDSNLLLCLMIVRQFDLEMGPEMIEQDGW
jgi:hypothetical protein